jgi:hypothetical protein
VQVRVHSPGIPSLAATPHTGSSCLAGFWWLSVHALYSLPLREIHMATRTGSQETKKLVSFSTVSLEIGIHRPVRTARS